MVEIMAVTNLVIGEQGVGRSTIYLGDSDGIPIAKRDLGGYRRYPRYRQYRLLSYWLLSVFLWTASFAWSVPMAVDSTSQILHGLFEDYLEKRFELDPYYATIKLDNRYNNLFANTWSSDWIERYLALEETFLRAVTAVPERGLSRRDQIDRQVFIFQRRNELENYRYPIWLLPVSPVVSRLNNFARMGAGKYYFPFETVQDYDDWLARVAAAGPWFEQLILNFSMGIEAGVVHPKVVAERLLPQMEAHVVDDVDDSLYYRPIQNMPSHFSAAERKRLDVAFRRMIREQLVPAYRRIAVFLRQQYIPAARASTAWRDLPDGAAWYRQFIRHYTSTEFSAADLHAVGLAQIAQLDAAVAQLGGELALADTSSVQQWSSSDSASEYYRSEAQLLGAYRSLIDRANGTVDQLFRVKPRAQLEVWPVEAFRAVSASRASYRRPPADLSGPGVVYVNTSDLMMHPKGDIETLFLHEAIPGHHFQLALMLEMEDLPRVRRFETQVVFTEGWALYAQTLGLDMGFYQEGTEQLGYLNSMRFRAARLVVDTGLHALGWSRQRAIRYMSEHTMLTETVVRNEVDRYIARPGQALAYMTGYLQIVELRRVAEATLGDRFDLREFHHAVLEDGAVPMPVLDEKIEAWISKQSF
jgi:uncharacterized protein (DUF885 family)